MSQVLVDLQVEAVVKILKVELDYWVALLFTQGTQDRVRLDVAKHTFHLFQKGGGRLALLEVLLDELGVLAGVMELLAAVKPDLQNALTNKALFLGKLLLNLSLVTTQKVNQNFALRYKA